ncbi:MAG: holo-ACP synthase [Magnetococcales bacterium]|nr:holo-ACP synthase [Magnetococcales bacterium]
MILGVGTDLVAIDRIAQAMRRFPDRFMERVLTPAEIRWCMGRQAMTAACCAKRFAAKEALVKALGTGMRGGIWFTEMELDNDPLGRPSMTLHGAAARRAEELAAIHGMEEVVIHLSLADEGGFALAHVVLEGRLSTIL